MEKIIEIVVKRPVSVLMVIVSILILGLISLSKLSIDFMPSMQVPYISIFTRYKNSGPEEIEKSVTKIIEGAVATVNDIKNITSTSREDSSNVLIEFNWGVDLTDATEDIREALEQVSDLLPDNAEKPIIRKFNMDDTSLMEIAVYGIDDQAALYNIADNQIAPQIKQAKGVAQAEVLGGLKNEIKIDVNLNRLKAYNININEIASALSRDNNNLVGGQADNGFYKYTIRTMGEIKSIDDIKNTAISLKTDGDNKSIVKIQDLAEVYQGYDDDVNIIRVNGRNSISIAVSKESGANTAEVSKNVIKQLEEYNFPSGVRYQIMFNTADSINEAIAGVLDAAWQGGLFAVIVLMIYMWNIRTVSIIAISIPLSIIVTFTLMYFMKITLNVISLSGLVLGIGMMVDNSIVVLENIFYYRNNGFGKYSSAINGTSKVSLAISASTFTTIAVFLPFLYLEGMTSQIFRDLCITVTISMIASLLVALLIVPMFGARLVTNKKLKLFSKLETLSNKYIHNNINNIYNKLLTFSIKRKKTVLIPSMILVSAVIILGLKFIGKEGFPRTDEGQFMVNVTMPIGTKYEQTLSFISLMENDIKEIIGDDLKRIQSRIRKGNEANSANIRIQLKAKKDGRIGDINDYSERTREKLQLYPAKINVRLLGSMSGGSSGGEAIRIEMLGDDVEQAKELGNRIVSAISNIEGIRGAMVDIDESNRELQVYVNRNIAAKMGLKINDVARIINTSFAGRTATTITPENSDFTDIDVNVQLENIDKVTIEDVEKISIPVKGVLIPLSSIADIVKSYGPNRIERKDRKRFTVVIANTYGRPLNEIISEVKNNIEKDVFIPNGISVNYGGDFEDMNEAFAQLIQTLILALVLVYAIMASQFESLIAPFVIAFAIPFGFAGSLIALFITNTTLSAYSAIGCIVLIGIVVNNGIVLIDYMNQLMHEKHINGDESALLAGKRRLRPVLMTTLTTILGILPMALGIGSGNEMYKPLAIALLGGLIVSTLFTLIIVPTIYAAIRNKIPLKDYDKKDRDSANDFAVNNAVSYK